MSGGQDQAAEAIQGGAFKPGSFHAEVARQFAKNDFEVAEAIRHLRHQIASLQVDQAIIRARLDSIDGRLTAMEKLLPKFNEQAKPERMTLGPPVQFKLGDQWKVGQVVVAAEDVESWACQRDPFRIIVSCLDGMWLVPAEMLETKPLRTD